MKTEKLFLPTKSKNWFLLDLKEIRYLLEKMILKPLK